ncbi:ECF transporter S component [Selenihalanaerobacter shriftii]|uniref:Niacin transporter n=1 Tax=Selenihalanaerobacter shriftii TaxID=142842 RepID=A0A1T4LCQ6_9FIRM|nr:ECF transporter S component [Selenihalanaerobacter shriftii]SJZ52317.1 niacin transporter [Selenihalanaerobacter shriftii]
MKIKDLVYGALLTALALAIPLMFGGYLRVYIPPFSATLASHVPTLIAMIISPLVAGLVGVGSTLGFLMILGPTIAARAAVHIVVGVVGALWIQKGKTVISAFGLTTLIHALGEALIVIPFGFSLYKAGVVIGVGTVLHHAVDAMIALTVIKMLGWKLSNDNERINA